MSSDEGKEEEEKGDNDSGDLGVAELPHNYQTAQQGSVGTSTSTTYRACSHITHMGSVTAGRDVNILNPRKVLLQCPVHFQSRAEKKKELSTTEKLRQSTLSKIHDWTRDMVKTSALDKVMEKLKKGIDWITIRGSPGEGKTTVGLMALGELHKQGRDVFLLTSPREFSQVISSYPLSVIMLDDVFGDLEFDMVKWRTWKDVLHQVLSLKEHRSHEKQTKKFVTVILIGREYVLKTAYSDMGRMADYFTEDEYVVNMSHTTVREIQEKYAIWKAVSDSCGIELDESTVHTICHIKVPHGFPHVCRLFVTIRKKNSTITAEEFFRTPLEFLKQTMLQFMKDKLKLILFKELLKSDNKVNLRELGKLDSGFETIQTAYDLVGTYLRKEDDCFVFDHPSIYDSVAYNICNLYPLFVIDNCNLSFIHERVRLEPSRDTRHETPSSESDLVAYIPRSYVKDLAKRFAVEISKHNLHQVFSHKEFRNGPFIKEVMSMLQSLNELITITDCNSGENFLSLLASNKYPHLLKYVHYHIGRQLTENEINTVLYGVCKYAASDVLNYLVELCDTLDMNVKYRYIEITPLMIAAETKESQFVLDILSLNPDVNARDSNDKTAFHYLCENGLVSAVKQTTARVPDIDMKDRLGRSPLFFACWKNQIEVVKLLLDRGARIDGSAMRLACQYGDEEIVSLLCDRGATVNMADYGQNPLHCACSIGNMKVIRYLIDKSVTSVNVQDDESYRTPLHAACNSHECQAAQYLLDHGADMESRDWMGYTPLHAAATVGAKDCVDVLLKAGAGVNVQSKDGYTPLHEAVKRSVHGSKECVELLLKAGADVNLENDDGQISLHTAVHYKPYRSGSPDITAFYSNLPDISICLALIRNCSEINKQRKDGNTPLHLVCRVDRYTTIYKDGSQETAYSYEDVYRRLVSLLIDHGADANIHNNIEQPALRGWCQTLVTRNI